jgi:hypothetical protein
MKLLIIRISMITTPVSSVRLTIPDPPVGSILGEVWYFPHVGASGTGIALDLEGCHSGSFQLGEVLIEVPSPLTGCHFWGIEQNAGVDDCDGGTRFIAPWFQYLTDNEDCSTGCASWQWCWGLPPSQLDPPDGASDVALNTQPSAQYGHEGNLWITSDPSCDPFDVFDQNGNEPWLPAGYLQPHATYHWYVEFTGLGCSNVGALRSAVQSFTTGGSVATTARPWSVVKTLYR